MMKVLLISLNTKYIHSSLAIRYLQAYCRNEYPRIQIMEFTINEGLGEVMAEIYRRQPDVVGFSCYIWNIEATLKLARNLKKIYPELVVVLGGPEVSFDSVRVLEQNPFLDWVVRGEGEETFLELLRCLSTSTGKAIKGTTYRDGERVIYNEDRGLISDLGSIPFPYVAGLDGLADRTIYYETSRGCPFSCSYCISSTFRGVRNFPLQRVKNDLRFLVEQGAQEIKFVDRTFNANPHRSREIMEFLMDLHGSTVFHLEIVADQLDDDMLAFLATVPPGLFKFEIGVQSTNELALRTVNRRMNWNRLQYAVQTIGSQGNIHQHLDLIAGLPGEDYLSFANSFNMVYNLAPDYLQLGFLKMLKGSSLREAAGEYDYRFTSEPPYEVLANRFVSYDEMLRLKRIEDLLEKYYNSRDFKHSLHYLTREVYGGKPFTFYEQLAAFWEEHGLHRIQHRKDAFYSLLIQFVGRNLPQFARKINELLKLDYLLNYKSFSLPDGLIRTEMPEQRNRLEQFLIAEDNCQRFFPDLKGLSVGKLKRQLHLEVFAEDVFFLSGIRQERVERSYYAVLFRYPPGGKKAIRWDEVEI